MELSRAGDVAQFINAASAALSDGVNDDELRLVLIRRLAEQGLARRAAEVAKGCSESLRSDPQFAAMSRTLEAARPNGSAPWTRFAGRFDKNTSALRLHCGWVDELVETWARERDRLELHQTRDGVFQVFHRREKQEGYWRPVFGDPVPKPSADELAKQFKNQIHSPIALVGVGLGWHLPWLCAATKDTLLGATPVIYQIEHSLAAVGVALHLNDWRDVLNDPRVRLCCGSDAYEQFERMVEDDDANLPPRMVVRAPAWTAPAGTPIGERVDELARRFESRRASLRESVSANHRGRGREWWRRRYENALNGDEKPLRVLGITCRFSTVLQYSMRDMLQAFRENGCETRLLIEPNDYSRTTPITMLSAIGEFEPDLLMIIDHTRAGQRTGLVENTPFLAWVQDRMPNLFRREAGAAMGPLDFCMGFSRGELVSRFGYPGERFMACEMATDQAALFAPGANPEEVIRSRSDEDDPEFACDVAYATTHSQTPEAIHESFRKNSAPNVVKFLDAAYDELVALASRSELNGGLALASFVERIEAATGVELSEDDRTTLAEDYVRPLTDKLLRHQMVEWASDWAEQTGRRFHLYGNGWDAHPKYRKYSRGFVKHGPDLGRAFRAAKINLHTGCNNALHQRILDGLSAGGFFLIRRHADDVGYPLWEAIDRVMRERNLTPGVELCWKDMPPPWDQRYASILRMRGLYPHMRMPITQAFLDRFEKVRDAEVSPTAGRIWPELDEVMFDTKDEFVERLEHFLANDEQRFDVAASMRRRMSDVYGYEALVKRLLAWMVSALGTD